MIWGPWWPVWLGKFHVWYIQSIHTSDMGSMYLVIWIYIQCSFRVIIFDHLNFAFLCWKMLKVRLPGRWMALDDATTTQRWCFWVLKKPCWNINTHEIDWNHMFFQLIIFSWSGSILRCSGIVFLNPSQISKISGSFFLSLQRWARFAHVTDGKHRALGIFCHGPNWDYIMGWILITHQAKKKAIWG